jgi:proteasome accessory factor C
VVTVRVSHPLWLEGMLLRLGGHARVLSPPGAGDSAGEVAREALEQYAALGLA